ncbi:MAG: 2-oxoacid:ferredoxin oxidoreductase subunit beta [Bacteroidetes bacterium]|nr:MAG: 2-oxoacid:ferredoxin oxidoreductase subunit beta [Bacteroidota bacterium]
MLDKTIEKSPVQLTKEDFASDQMVKWCPGCGGHAILTAVENVFPRIGYKKENFTIVSGIGCSSRFPYYVNTYGFHGIHGRASAIASGVKLANPGQSVWIATGDGDSMAIGGNHFIHIIRRNIDVNILLFNNQIYGLTKGQFSPTTPIGQVTKTSPQGTIEHPFITAGLVMGAQGTFFARVPDNNVKLMTEVLYEAAKHDGTSVVEILENCIIFNDKAHAEYTSRARRDDNQLILKHGEPMIYGKERDMGIILKGTSLYAVKIGVGGITEKDILIHDQFNPDPGVHRMLGRMSGPEYPVAMGVIRSAKSFTYDDKVEEQIEFAKKNSKIKCVDDLLNSGDTWEI